MLTVGILLAYFSNHLLAPLEAWRWMLAAPLIPGFVILIGVIFMLENPRWLLQRNRESKARSILEAFRSSGEIEDEIQAIKQIEQADNNSTMFIIKSAWARPALIVGALVGIFQQIVGINAVIYYAPTIFRQADLADAASTAGTTDIGLVNVLMTIVAVMLVDKVGRKNLLALGSATMAGCLIALSATLFTVGLDSSTAWLTVIFLCL